MVFEYYTIIKRERKVCTTKKYDRKGDIGLWVIFLVSAIAIAFTTMVLLWVGNKIFLSIRRDNRKYDIENSKLEKGEDENDR